MGVLMWHYLLPPRIGLSAGCRTMKVSISWSTKAKTAATVSHGDGDQHYVSHSMRDGWSCTCSPGSAGSANHCQHVREVMAAIMAGTGRQRG
jgi:hypothetical protein